MAPRYASTTTVSVEKSRAEIERILDRYGANQFGYVRDDSRGLASIYFRANSRQVRFTLTLPRQGAKEFWESQRGRRTEKVATERWEQACRQRWRALTLCIKAKLEAVESEISTFEDEFMAHIVLPNGNTVGELMRPQIEHAYTTKEQPVGIAGLLPAPRDDTDSGNVIDAKGKS